ncbi:MAG: TetR/AcrR family transcriptional regulator [Verrucomicrobiota bacterium]|nr:TetR/AcrR family transcriptional regulator [Verrucomicrobiota bacterium]
MALPAEDSQTRRQILRAALRRFAHCGYAATSVQQIVSDAKVSKPALYYYFPDKAGLFQALVHEAHDERYRLLREAAARSQDIRGQLVGILTVLFDYFQQNRELMRISFATMFAAPGEVPPKLCQGERCERNFDFVHSLIQHAQTAGELDQGFESREMAFGFYGLCNSFLMAHLVMPDCQPDKNTAQRVVDLFLRGAAAKPKAKRPRRGAKQLSAK